MAPGNTGQIKNGDGCASLNNYNIRTASGTNKYVRQFLTAQRQRTRPPSPYPRLFIPVPRPRSSVRSGAPTPRPQSSVIGRKRSDPPVRGLFIPVGCEASSPLPLNFDQTGHGIALETFPVMDRDQPPAPVTAMLVILDLNKAAQP